MKQFDRNEESNSNIKLKIFAGVTTLTLIASGFKIVSLQEELKETLLEEQQILQEYEELLGRYQELKKEKEVQTIPGDDSISLLVTEENSHSTKI